MASIGDFSLFGLNQEFAARLLISLIVGLVGCSVSVWAQLALQWRRGESPLPFLSRETVVWSPVVLMLSLGWLALDRLNRFAALVHDRFAVDVQPATPLPEVSIAGVQANVLIGLSIVLIITSALLWQSPRRSLADYGMTFDAPGSDVRLGVLGAFAAVLPVFLVALSMTKLRNEETQHTLFKLLKAHPEASTVIWIAVAAVLVAPLMEELVFRVVLQSWLKTRLPEGAALGITAVAFSAIHGWPDMIPLLPLSIILGVVYHRTNRYFAVVLLHALFNAGNLAVALLGQAANIDT